VFGCGYLILGGGCGGRLRLSFFQEQGDVGVGFGVPDQKQFSSVDGGDAHIEHLEGGKLLKDCSRHQSGGMAPELLAQGGHEAVSEKGDEQVCFDALGFLMKDGRRPRSP